MRTYPIVLCLSLGCGGEVTPPDTGAPPVGGVACTPSWSLLTPQPVEGDTVEFEVICQNGSIQDTTLTVVSGPAEVTVTPDGLVQVPTDLDDAGKLEVTVGVQSVTSEAVELDVWVADALGAAGNAPVSPTTYRREFDTLVLHLDLGGAAIGDVPQGGTATVDGDAYTVSVVAESSADAASAKRSALVTATGIPIDWNEGGVDDRTTLRLFSMGHDPSYLRQRMVHEMWEEMREDAALGTETATRAFYTTVYLNGAYHGLYLATEIPDADLVAEAGLSVLSEVWQATTEDANYDTVNTAGVDKLTLSEGFTKISGGIPGDNAALDAWIADLVEPDPNLMWGALQVTSDAQSWLDWMALCRWAALSGNQTVGHAVIRDATLGTWYPLPWGFDSGLGLDATGGAVAANASVDLTSANAAFDKILVSSGGSGLYQTTWDAHTTGPDGVLSLDWQQGKVTTWTENHGLAFDRDSTVWGTSPSPDQAATELEDWLSQRAAVATP